jgi:hypothetical protein
MQRKRAVRKGEPGLNLLPQLEGCALRVARALGLTALVAARFRRYSVFNLQLDGRVWTFPAKATKSGSHSRNDVEAVERERYGNGGGAHAHVNKPVK